MRSTCRAVALAAAACLTLVPALPLRAQSAVGSPAAAAPTLAGVLGEVLNADPQVRVARGVLGIAQARAQQARSRYWPSAGVSAVAGESTDREFNVDVRRHTERVEGVLRWNLYSGGTDRAEIAATEREIASAQFEFDRARGDVAERVAEAWIDAQRTRAVAAASRRRLHDVARLTNQVAAQGAAGRLSESDVLQASATLSETQVQHELALADADGARARLETLTGRDLLAMVPAGFPALAVPDTLVHPSVRAARERADASAARRRQLAEALAPRLDLELRHRIVDRTDPAPTTALRRGATMQLTWDVPLGGETFARQDEAQKRAEASLAEAERIELLLRADLAALRQRERAEAEAVERTSTQVEQSRALLRAAAVQFESGRRTVQQLIQTRDAQFAAEQRYAEAQARLQLSRMRQWSTAGALLAAVGLEPGGPAVTPAAAPVMDLTPDPAAALPALAKPASASSVAAPAPAAQSAPSAPPSVASVASVASAGSEPPGEVQNAIFERMIGWLAAWKARDVEAYLGFYGRGFVPAKGLTRAQWEQQRRRVLGQKGTIDIEIVEPAYEPRGELVGLSFVQQYRSDSFRDKVRKRVDWAREGDSWKIVRETTY